MTPQTTAGSIAILPDQLVDQIAAGEVIERPASVAKELVENSLDAGATQIDIAIENAGSGLIRVVDNGHGMVPEDVRTCVKRHATSKIGRLEDLSSLLSYGFRGEALASIASVCHLEIVSRHHDRDEAIMLFWEGGTLSEEREIGAAVGTSISVRHLFFNTPARREFMRAPTTETRRIIETVTDAACANPDVGFSLTLDGQLKLQAAPAAGLRDRLIDLFGSNLASDLIEFSGGEGDLTVYGFVGKAEIARSNRDRILTFVNKRRIASPSLAHAATAAYGEMIPRGRFPFAIVCLDVNPHRVDVNVHPTKREVRFANERAVYDITYYSINKAVFGGPRTSPVMKIEERHTPQHGQPMRLPFSPQAQRSTDALYKPMHADTSAQSAPLNDVSPRVDVPSQEQPLPESQGMERALRPSSADSDGVTNLWQFNDLYIAAAVGDELWIIDQHTAHERVLYEQVLRRIQDNKPESQRLLFPESIDLEARDWDIFESSAEILASLGFEVRSFGTRTVLLEGVPTGLRMKNPVLLFRRVLEDLENARKGGEDLTRAAAASMACRAAVMSGDRLTREEMQGLFAQLMHTENPFSCPHGRPTMVKIPILDFDRKFCRA